MVGVFLCFLALFVGVAVDTPQLFVNISSMATLIEVARTPMFLVSEGPAPNFTNTSCHRSSIEVDPAQYHLKWDFVIDSVMMWTYLLIEDDIP